MTTQKKGEFLPTILVIFGATGDLTRRKLVPALWHLFMAGKLPNMFSVMGFARSAHTNEEFRELISEMLLKEKKDHPRKFKEFCSFFFYEQGEFEDAKGYDALSNRLGLQDKEWRTCANKLFYLAVPPQYYGNIFDHLASSGLTLPCSEEEGWTRVIVEKPFGRDLETAQALDAKLGTLFREEQIYRIDHYLGKDTVQNILAFRFSNTIFDPAWDGRSIANIHIAFNEKLTVKGRAGFYDGVGALRDVGQNHMLQLLALFTMENPGEFTADSIRGARTEALSALEVMDVQDVVRQTVRGQYRGYLEEGGVEKRSDTETYFRIETHMRTPRWQGVPIVLESGKGLCESKVEVTVTFRHQMPCLCPDKAKGVHYTNVLKYSIQPHEGVSTSFWVKKPGMDMVIEQKDFSFDYRQAYKGDEFNDAYSTLLLDAIEGDQTLFVSTPEILSSWRFIDPILKGWREGTVALAKYDVSTKEAIGTVRSKGVLPSKQIGYVGLGKMGQNMVERLVAHGYDVVATDPDAGARAKAKKVGAHVKTSAKGVVSSLAGPRVVWLMVPHQVVDEVLEEIIPTLNEGDTVIDGGNSFYVDSVRRAKELEEKGIHYLDVGVSGGPSGARRGSCLMVGGKEREYKKYVGLFSDLASAGGYDYMGTAGAGHFVKMVHNGIEYGMMQAIGEGFAVMKASSEYDLDLEKVANLYNHDSVIESRLIGWLKSGYAQYGQELEDISGKVSHSGEGLWTVETARKFGIPVPIIEGSLQFREDSQDDPSYTGQVVSALRNQFGGHKVKN